ncbi:MAG: TIR domain-containing protein [Chloroflexi bacterium]|nr:TIR domain-containing protein [Chloroflexota bacterium]
MLFVSHATTDDGFVNRIDEALKAAGIETWIDHKRLPVGGDWHNQIQENLIACDGGVIVLSPRYIGRPECINELRTLLDLPRPIFPALIETMTKEEFPYRLRTIQYANLARDFEGEMKRLIEAVNGGRTFLEDDASPEMQHLRTSHIKFTLNTSMAGFNIDKFVTLVAKLSDEGLQNIEVVYVGEGSVIVILGLPQNAADVIVSKAKESPELFDKYHLSSIALLSEEDVKSIAKTAKKVTRNYDDRYSTYVIPMQGREADLAQALDDLKQAPLFIVGVGGLGKSRLAAEIVQMGDYSGAVWLRVGDTTTSEELYRLLREHYGLEAITPPEKIIERVRQDGWLLVVIDNAEAIPDNKRPEFERLADQLALAQAAVIVTTRVMDWGIPKRKRSLEPSLLAVKDAARVVQAMADEFGIERDTAPFAEELAQAARLHPRLIELAVGKLDYETAGEIMHELRTLSHDVDEALSEMFRKTALQMEVHDPSATATLRRLVVCRGGFTREAAQAISGLDDDALRARLKTLIDYRFVRFNGERYSIDDLVRLAIGEDEDAHRAHFDYYLAHTQAVGGDQTKHDRYQKLAVESENMDAAFTWALETEPAQACWLAITCREFLNNRGRFADQMARFTVLEQRLADVSDERTRSAFYLSLGNVYSLDPFGALVDNLRRAIDAYQKALHFWSPRNEPLEYANVQSNLGNTYWRLATVEDPIKNLHQAIDSYQEALRFQPPETTPLYYAMTQTNLGNAYSDLAKIENKADNLRRAITAYHEALRFYTAEATPLYYATTQNNLGPAYAALATVEDHADNLHHAIIALQEALRFHTAEDAPLDYAAVHNNLGNVYRILAVLELREENLHLATIAYQEALRFRTAQAVPLDYAITEGNLGIAFKDSGDLHGAIACWREAEPYFRAAGYVAHADKIRHWIEDAEAQLAGSDSTP